MRKIVCFAVLFIFTSNLFGVTPVHMGRISFDTSLYQYYPSAFVPDPFTAWNTNLYSAIVGGESSCPMLLGALLKKNTHQFDVYSFGGKIGTSVIPDLENIFRIIFSRKMVDDDGEWESIVDYKIETQNKEYFKVFDHDGTELLADSGLAYYGFDGNNTYVVSYIQGDKIYNVDSWRFRTNISSESPKTLAKTNSIQPSPMQIFGLPGGDYRVTLAPSSGNQINFQMFDLLGRCVFDKQIENLNRPVSFTVPEGNVPNSPFIAKVNDGNNTVVKKQISVK